MANPEHLAILKQGVRVWNQWREENSKAIPDFIQADLRRCDLSAGNFYQANFMKAYLSGAILKGANLRGAELSGAFLDQADLAGADLLSSNSFMTIFFEADLRAASFIGANLSRADLWEADLRDADLTNAVLVETNLRNANLSGCRVYGISVWDCELSGAIQSNLIITRQTEPIITVDNLEVAQFIYLLLNNEKIRQVIDTITTKVVLILGRFTDERKKILDSMREELRRRNYVPILFDFDKPATRDLTETITTLAGMSRFIIADITDPRSLPQELASIIPHLPSVPVQPLLQSSQHEYGMFEHFERYTWVLPICRYDQPEDVIALLAEKVIAPAEAKAKELQKR